MAARPRVPHYRHCREPPLGLPDGRRRRRSARGEAMARIATLRAALSSEPEELADVRRQLGALAATMQALPAVGALTLALFGTLGASPQYQRLGPTVLLATGLLPFVVLVIVSAREFGRAAN